MAGFSRSPDYIWG